MVTKNGHKTNIPHLKTSLDRLFSEIDSDVARILDRALAGEDISVEDGTTLLEAEGSPNVNAIALAADDLRRKTVGDVVTYIINRNIFRSKRSCAGRAKPGSWEPPRSASRRVCPPR